LRIGHLPQGEDPDTYIRSTGQEGFQTFIDQAHPLSEVLWRAFVDSTPLKTPEDKARARQKLMKEVLDAIKNSEVREFYAQSFFSRLRELLSPPSPRTKSPVQGRTNATIIRPIPQAQKKNVLGQKILLATLVNHPKLIESVIDKLMIWDLEDPPLSALKDKLIDLSSETSLFDKSLYTYLEDQSFGPLLKELLSPSLRIHAGFISETIDDEAALEGWQAVWHSIAEKQVVQQELKDAEGLFKQNFDQAHWERLKTLRSQLGESS
jgi:DNA primase